MSLLEQDYIDEGMNRIFYHPMPVPVYNRHVLIKRPEWEILETFGSRLQTLTREAASQPSFNLMAVTLERGNEKKNLTIEYK